MPARCREQMAALLTVLAITRPQGNFETKPWNITAVLSILQTVLEQLCYFTLFYKLYLIMSSLESVEVNYRLNINFIQQKTLTKLYSVS